jgi:hypothetical protein
VLKAREEETNKNKKTWMECEFKKVRGRGKKIVEIQTPVGTRKRVKAVQRKVRRTVTYVKVYI